MKRLYFNFVLILFSSLFILSGCYTSFKTQERESTYESIVLDSSEVIVQNYNYFYDGFWFQSSWYYGYEYPYWYRNSYWYNPWSNLRYGFYWDGYKFRYWNYWYGYPHIRHYPHYLNQDDWWWTHQPLGINSRFIRFRTRDNDGGRGIERPDIRKPQNQNPSGGNMGERRRDIRTDDKNTRTRDENIRNDQNREKIRDSGGRIRDSRPIEKKPPQTTEPRKDQNSERQRSPQVTPPKRDPSSERQRKEPTRTTPQNNPNNPTREKSSNENPTKSNTTRDRGRG